mgnify:FL=1
MLKIVSLLVGFILLTGCSEFALLMSGSSIAISQNAYVKAYNGADFLTVISTEKSIKRHIYDQSRRYIIDQSLGFRSD